MEQNPNKKQEFTKYKELFTQKVDEQALETIKLIKTTIDKFDKKIYTEFTVNTKQYLSSKGAITNTEAMKSINTKLNSLKTESPETKLFKKLTFNETIQEGDQFCPIKDLNCVFEEKTESLEHKEGIVYLIYFWDISAKRLIQCNQEMLEKNEEKWKGKVEIYSILQESLVDTKKILEDKKLHSIHHYQSDFKEQIRNYAMELYIIDQKGMIVYSGSMEINVEEFINKILDKSKADKLTKEKYKEMKTQIEQFMKKNITKEDKFTLNISFKKKKIFDSKWNVLEKKYHNPTLSYVVKITHNDKLQKLLQRIYDKYPKAAFKIKKEQIIDNKVHIENCIKVATNKLVANGLTSIPTLHLTAHHLLKFY